MNNPQGSTAEAFAGLIVFLAITAVLGAAVGFLGWTAFITAGLWLVVIASALGALVLAGLASESKNEKKKTECWIASAVCVAISFVTWVSVPSAAPDAADSEVIASDSDAASLSLKGQRTLEYWRGLHSSHHHIPRQPETVQETLDGLNSWVRQIDQLPTAGVDIDAVHCGLAFRQHLTAMAARIERRNSTTYAVELLARGFQGDVLGPLAEAAQSDTAFEQLSREVWHQLASTRAILSARYGVEFPG